VSKAALSSRKRPHRLVAEAGDEEAVAEVEAAAR